MRGTAKEELILNLDRLYTTDLGIVRIKRNLSLDTEDVVDWCRKVIQHPDAFIFRKGKNWYIQTRDCELTVNAYSYTIITAHKFSEQHKKKAYSKPRLLVERISPSFHIKQFTEDDLTEIWELCKENTTYYRYMKMEPTLENLKDVLTTLPPNKAMEDKYFLGFYRNKQLIAILDFVCGYPRPDTAYIGWFMLNRQLQGSGIGTELVTELFCFLEKEGFQSIQLGCIKTNKEGLDFWLKQGFQLTGLDTNTGPYIVVGMEKFF